MHADDGLVSTVLPSATAIALEKIGKYLEKLPVGVDCNV